jgi:hypothetical protein
VPEPSNVARIAHNLGLATWFGGALFGQVALNPTISRISDSRERGRVLSESWGRFNAVTFATIAASILTWRLGGLREDAELRAPALTRIKNLLLGGAVVNGIASGILGARIAKEAPGEAPEDGTPVEAGTQPAPETPAKAAQAQRLISITGPSALSLLATVIALSAIIDSSAVKPRGILSRLFL